MMATKKSTWLGFAVAICGLLTGCAPQSRIILLPDANGRATAVEVSSGGATQVLLQPYQQVEVDVRGALQRSSSSADEVQKRHPTLLSMQPAAEQRFVLRFEPGGAVLTAESQAQLGSILEQAVARPGGEIIVVGHTDRVGSPAGNDALSLQRARVIRDMLVAKGFDSALVEAVGRGEREPDVPTEAQVDEPRNRRAVIIVR
jgi:outer membrane protein OmpA-like peptidoglycan-associated protein